MKLLQKLTLLMLLAGQSLFPAAATAETAAIPSPVVVTSTVKPWGLIAADGSDSGILVDFQQVLFSRAGIPLHNSMLPYPRVIQEMSSGRADLAVMFVSPLSEQIAVSLGQVVEEHIIIVTRADAPDYKTLDDFSGKDVGQVRGSRYGNDFDSHPQIHRIPVTDVDQGLKMLLSGRLDAMASTEHSLLYAMYTTGISSDRVRIALPLFTARADLYVTRSQQHALWVQPLRHALQSMSEDGSLRPSLYQRDYWPYDTFCFAGGQCLNTH